MTPPAGPRPSKPVDVDAVEDSVVVLGGRGGVAVKDPKDLADQVTVAVLADGYQCYDYPSSEGIPARRVLAPGQNRMREVLDARVQDNHDAHEQIVERNRAKLVRAQARLDAAPTVPNSKRCI